jgi:type I restriction enzyme R subunit
MRIAIDKFKIIKDNNYCVRITSDEGEIGKDLLELFQDNDRDMPVILTSSKMLTTGVDARNVRNIVLTAPIKSMTEFKQIIGRGTRVFEGKDFFTIIDFVGATKLFYDDRWDGEPVDTTTTTTVAPVEVNEPVEVNQPDDNQPIDTPDNQADIKIDNGGSVEEPPIYEPKPKVIIEIRNKKLKVINIETSYVGEGGRPLSTKEYLELLIDILGEYYQDGDGLREIWSNPRNRKNLLEKLRSRNIDETQLNDLKQVFDAENSDIYDLLAHLSFNLEIKTRKQRAENAGQSEFVRNHNNRIAQELIRFILGRYESDGFTELADDKLSTLINLSGLGTPREVAVNFGGINQLKHEYFELQREIYR